VAIHIVGAAEAIVLGEKAGLDPSMLVEVLADSAATSRMLEVRGPSMATGAYASPMMKVDVFQKDLDIIAAFASQSKCPVPLFSTAVPFFTEVAAQGMGLQDTAAVVSALRSLAGMEAR
jgi:3-hydroxyisobutyrate dehydrogenase-like beta-hydroxyacid dehydrogenase